MSYEMTRAHNKIFGIQPAQQEEPLSQEYAYRGPTPDCRTCKRFYDWEDKVCTQSNKNPCINGDRYQPLPPVRLYRTAP